MINNKTNEVENFFLEDIILYLLKIFIFNCYFKQPPVDVPGIKAPL
jgi:hypothetical protein